LSISIVNAGDAAQAGRLVRRRAWPQLAAVVAGGAVFNCLLAVPIRTPRIFGDELIYWQLARGFAWTGHFVVRGGTAPHYGVVYPALLAVAQRIGSDQTSAYAIAQGLNAVIFSLTAIPAYAIASRVLQRRHALLAALLAVVLPSCVYSVLSSTEPDQPCFASAKYNCMQRPLARTSRWRVVTATGGV